MDPFKRLPNEISNCYECPFVTLGQPVEPCEDASRKFVFFCEQALIWGTAAKLCEVRVDTMLPYDKRGELFREKLKGFPNWCPLEDVTNP